MRKFGEVTLLAVTLACVAAAANSSGSELGNESVTYTYDELGRLTGSTITGGPNNTQRTGTCFDRAGNRMRYDMATSAPSTCPTPSPTPTPSP